MTPLRSSIYNLLLDRPCEIESHIRGHSLPADVVASLAEHAVDILLSFHLARLSPSEGILTSLMRSISLCDLAVCRSTREYDLLKTLLGQHLTPSTLFCFFSALRTPPQEAFDVKHTFRASLFELSGDADWPDSASLLTQTCLALHACDYVRGVALLGCLAAHPALCLSALPNSDARKRFWNQSIHFITTVSDHTDNPRLSWEKRILSAVAR